MKKLRQTLMTALALTVTALAAGCADPTQGIIQDAVMMEQDIVIAMERARETTAPDPQGLSGGTGENVSGYTKGTSYRKTVSALSGREVRF